MLFLVLVLVALAAYRWWRRNHESLEPPKCQGGWPLLGHAPSLIGDSCHLWNAVKNISNKCHDIGGVCSIAFGLRTIYIITDPDDCLTVMNTCLEKDPFYDFAKPWLGDGLVTSKFSIWERHRKLLNPAFSQAVLDSFINIFNGQARKLVNHLAKEVGKGPFDHWTHTKHNALETICLTALGLDFEDSTLLNSKYVEAAEQAFNNMAERFKKFWLHSPHIFRWSIVKKKQDECLKILLNVSETVLQRKKSELNGKKSLERVHDVTDTKKVFIDLLLELSMKQGVLSEREVREHVDTMIVAGHDTSANALMYTMLLLGSHPEAQEKAYAEIQKVVGSSDRDVEKHDLSQLVYLEAVLKESLRIYTIVPVVARWIDRDVKLKNYTLSSRKTCLLYLFGVHEHSMWGPDIHEFKPERWLDPATVRDNANAFSAFSHGKRMCIGKAYAFISMKTILAHVVRRYRITGNHKQLVLRFDLMLKPASGHYISIEPRT